MLPRPIIGVTGSDGKTTTTSLIAEMLRQSGKTVHLGGNIGRALFPELETVKPDDMAVVELSSFQLLSMRQSPEIAVVTNVTPNHLDVHGTMEEYIAAKKNIFLHQGAFTTTVLSGLPHDCRLCSGGTGRLPGGSAGGTRWNGAHGRMRPECCITPTAAAIPPFSR